jgi:hypothetical protein
MRRVWHIHIYKLARHRYIAAIPFLNSGVRQSFGLKLSKLPMPPREFLLHPAAVMLLNHWFKAAVKTTE